MDVIERDGPDMNPERLPSGTLLEDVGCPHCGKVCDVCCTYDEENAELRQQLQGAVEALRVLWDDIRETDKRFIPSDVRAEVDAALAGRSTHTKEETG